MQIQENISLKPFNTFGIDANAQHFSAFHNWEDLSILATRHPKPKFFVLGGGSNILFTKNFDGLVLKNEVKGIELIKEDEHHLYVRAGAGENWHQFVMYCIQRNWAGLENLSLIPGNVGASPMQNIGAYGVELKEVFESLQALNRNDNKILEFTANDCAFGYRESVFKRKYKDRFI